MSDIHEALSYTVTADDKASLVFRGISAELGKLQAAAQHPLQGINREVSALGSRKPLEFVKADQALVLARTEAEMGKLTKATQASGVATKLQNAEMQLLVQRHKQAQTEIGKTAASHTGLAKAATVASYEGGVDVRHP